jgi:hypothetical protein
MKPAVTSSARSHPLVPLPSKRGVRARDRWRVYAHVLVQSVHRAPIVS